MTCPQKRTPGTALRRDVVEGDLDRELAREVDRRGGRVHDDIIPSRPTCQLLEQLSSAATTQLTAIVYEQGYHMLTRDLQAEVVLEDIAAWIDAYEALQLTGRDLRLYCAQSGGGT